jgi:hypothetical protein
MSRIRPPVSPCALFASKFSAPQSGDLAGAARAVSSLVSFSAVQRGPVTCAGLAPSRPHIASADCGQKATDLESVLGATPRGFESLILRHPAQQASTCEPAAAVPDRPYLSWARRRVR